MTKFFPATLEGLATAIAFKKVYPKIEICLSGNPDEKIREFKQFKEVDLCGEEAIESEEMPNLSELVLKIKEAGIGLSPDDAELFACAIFSVTNGFTDARTTSRDVKALGYCFECGGKLSRISVKISFSKIFKMAREIMTKPVKCVQCSLKLSEVKEIIERTGFSGFPVVDNEGKIVGVVTKKDVERALKAGIEDLQLVMSIPPIIVKENESLDKIGELMAVHDIGRIVVVDNSMKVVGIVTRRDLVRAVVAFENGFEVTTSVSDKLKDLDPHLLSIFKLMEKVAKKRDEKIYVVGGFVRDLLRGEKSLDIDIVVEGSGTDFAREFALETGAEVHAHSEFNTATLIFDGISIDVATARTEYYENPGRLPKVEASNLRKDLYRRDFTINAMAISLNSEDFGTLFDFFGGKRDIHRKKIRVLHSMSFVEDPTRILRALRYATRFKYELEEKTLILLKDALQKKYLNSVSASRIRRELEKSLRLRMAEEVFETFQLYGVFDFLPCRREVNFQRYFEFVRKMERKINVFYSIILLLLKPCKLEIVEKIFEQYGVPKKFFNLFKKVYDPKFLGKLKAPISNSSLYFLLINVQDEALPILAYEDERIREKVLYFDKHLRNVKLVKINGKLLKTRGIEGVEIGKVMKKVLEMKLDNGTDEEEALRELTKGDKN